MHTYFWDSTLVQNSGAGDRDRTGDIQLGKLTFPKVARSKILKILSLRVSILFVIQMQWTHKTHMLPILHIRSPVAIDFGQYGQ